MNDSQDVKVHVADNADTESVDSGNEPRPMQSGFLARLQARKTRVAIALVAAVAVAVAVAVAITLTTASNNKSAIQVPKTFAAEFTTQNKLIPTVAYTGRAYKTEDASGKWSWQFVVESDATKDPEATVKTVYTVVDRRAYMQQFDLATGALVHSGCMTADDVPPLQDLTELFTNSAFAPNEEFDQEAVADCAGAENQKVIVQWGQPTSRYHNAFVYCARDDGSHRFISHQYVASIFNVNLSPAADGLGITTPSDVSGTAMNCPELQIPSAIAGMTSGVSASEQRRLAAAAAWYAAAAADLARRLAAPTRTCYFVPSAEYSNLNWLVGDGPEVVNPSADAGMKSYWGPMTTILKSSCAKFSFLRRNMRAAVADGTGYAPLLCADMNAANGGTIADDSWIFTHGTGSLVFGSALNSGSCRISGRTRWFAVGSPFNGSPFASATSSRSYGCGAGNSALGGLSKIGGCAAAFPTLPSAAWASIVNPDDLNSVETYAGTHVHGIMCGISKAGSGKLYNFENDADQMAVTSTKFDGVVAQGSCNPGDKNLGSSKDNVLYAAGSSNFLDITCRAGDAVIDNSGNRSPCGWYQARATADCAYATC